MQLTLQPVVATEKEAERLAFAKLLNSELTRIGAPAGRGRVAWVYRELRKRGRAMVSQEQVRKWMRGIDIPDQANLRMMCERLGLNWTALHPGAIGQPPSPLYLELREAFDELPNDVVRREVVEFARFKSVLANPPDKPDRARAEGKDSESGRSLQPGRRT